MTAVERPLYLIHYSMAWGVNKMKGLLAALIVGLFVVNAVGVSAAVVNPVQIQAKQSSVTGPLYTDELDQSQTVFDGALAVGYSNPFGGSYMNLSIAQSFIPQKDVLTRVEFFMGRNVTTTKPCVLAVRDNLTGADLAEVALQPSAFPVVNGTPQADDLAWVDFNFSDIWVTAGQTYYLVIYSTFLVDNFYWVSGNGSNNYPNGTVYLSGDNGTTWTEFTNADGCFKTYGLTETFLSVTPIGGLFGSKFLIRNTGNVTAWDVMVDLSVKGGLLGHINASAAVFIPELHPGDNVTVRSGPVIGFGTVHISLKIVGANVKESTTSAQARVFLFFLFF